MSKMLSNHPFWFHSVTGQLKTTNISVDHNKKLIDTFETYISKLYTIKTCVPL